MLRFVGAAVLIGCLVGVAAYFGGYISKPTAQVQLTDQGRAAVDSGVKQARETVANGLNSAATQVRE